MGYSGAGGKLIHEKNQKQKISWHCPFKGTQDWEFFWLRFCNLRYFFVSYVKILRFYKKNFLIGPLLGEVGFFRPRTTRNEKKFWARSNFFLFSSIMDPIYDPILVFLKIQSINCSRDDFMCWFGVKMSNFIPLSLRLRGIEFSLVSD